MYLQSKSALQRLVAALVIAEWARNDAANANHPDLVIRMHQCLSESVYFDEIALSFTKLMQETKVCVKSVFGPLVDISKRLFF